MKIFNISNRLPISVSKKDEEIIVTPSSGGLSTALDSVKKEDTELIWIGVGDFEESIWPEAEQAYSGNFKLVPVFVDENTYKLYYEGFSNSILWPLFHYFPSYVEYDNTYEQAYKEINEKIAETLIPLIGGDDLIWIHDYHLFSLPSLIRKAVPNVRIGFFLHIPFPAYELMRILPKKTRSMLLDGVLGADLIGFHTFDYCKHFLETIQIEKGISHEFFKFDYDNRTVSVNAHPISIDYHRFNVANQLDSVAHEKTRIQKLYADKKIIFSVDRLDYSKGVLFRLKGFQRFLESYPEWQEKVVFILVLIPSRTDVEKYIERKNLIDSLVSHINGKMGNFKWTPIIYQFHSLNFDELLGLYTGCDIALISPVRDGMNLVAKEFVASRSDQLGVLMLSEMTGAAKELNEALLFNPLDEDEIADKIKTALSMSASEQKARMAPMQLKIKNNDINFWTNSFLEHLQQSQNHIKALAITPEEKKKILAKYNTSTKRLILLDYDGTLSGFQIIPEDAIPSAEVLDLITKLAQNDRNVIAIVSGRDKDILEAWFGTKKIHLIAEHGAFVKLDLWMSTIFEQIKWKQPVLKIMKRFQNLSVGSFIEEKEYSIAWHYRQMDSQIGYNKSRELIETLQYFIANSGAKILDGNKVVEVKSAYMNKGTAINTAYNFENYDFCIAIGDDKTDEDMFNVINANNGISIKVGEGNTVAKYRLENQTKVITLLHDLSMIN